MMAPYEKSEHRDCHAGEGNKLVPEYLVPGKSRDKLAHHSHCRQHHYVNRRVRVKPEEMLKQQRIAAIFGVENAKVRQALERNHRKRDRQDRSPQNEDHAGCVGRPDEQRKPEPGQSWSAHCVDGDNEIQACQYRRESGDKDADHGRRDTAL